MLVIGNGEYAAMPCAACKGDCDSDSVCSGTLKCFQRDGMTKLADCDRGRVGDKKEHDFCDDPLERESTVLVTVAFRGLQADHKAAKAIAFLILTVSMD